MISLIARNCGLRRSLRGEVQRHRICWLSSGAGESRKDRRRREAAEALKAQTAFERNATTNTVRGATGEWEVIVGIELHAQINEPRKLFSNAPTSFGLEPNRFVAPLDAALPGTLPVLNVACVRRAVHTALALNARVNAVSFFDRKHYFYADMPAGFQITQHRTPIASGGHVDLVLDSGVAKRVSLAHIQLEQDSGKTVLGSGALERLVDLNRAGSALMEIVSHADMRSSAEAGSYVRHMQRLLRAVDSCAANMDQGDLRCDVNVSVRRAGAPQFGERVEIKNVNSVRFLVSAIDYEVDRQIALLEAGEPVEQETRAFDSRSSQTVRLRTKEQAVDYRFMPEPDLPPLHVLAESLAAWSRELPPLPAQLQAQLESECAMSARDALTVIDEPGALVYLRRLIGCGVEPASAAKWLLNDVIAHAHANSIDVARFPVGAERLAELIASIASGALTSAVARRVVWPRLLAGDARDSAAIASEHGVAPIDDAELERACAEAVALIASDADAAKAAKRVVEGDEKWMRFFVGKVMRATGGRANAELAQRRLHELIVKLSFLFGRLPSPIELVKRGVVRGSPNVMKRAQRGLYHGRGRLTGNNISFSHRKTRRIWLPNVQSKNLQSELLGETLKVRVTTRALRCIDRAGGLDNYLLTTRDTSIASLFGTELKRRVAGRYEEVNGVKFSRSLARRQQQQQNSNGSLKF